MDLCSWNPRQCLCSLALVRSFCMAIFYRRPTWPSQGRRYRSDSAAGLQRFARARRRIGGRASLPCFPSAAVGAMLAVIVICLLEHSVALYSLGPQACLQSCLGA